MNAGVNHIFSIKETPMHLLYNYIKHYWNIFKTFKKVNECSCVKTLTQPHALVTISISEQLDMFTTSTDYRTFIKSCNDADKCTGATINVRGLWNRETWQRGTISQGWTSRDLFQCWSRCSLQVYVWLREYYAVSYTHLTLPTIYSV